MLLCTGGCRSGKSEFARQWAETQSETRVFVATAYAGDAEMAQRIERHQDARGRGWVTYEAASGPWGDPEIWVAEAAGMGGVLLFDCLTLWTSLCLEGGYGEVGTLALTDRLLAALADCGRPVALVSNELGMGLVPDNALGRLFRDVAGLVNQKAAARADTVVFMVSGLPLYLKGTP
ncbi:bifunctional adenosylcobinamide kinase/adenosylcobinamide-phosphate guanylyltransferase [Desulfovibrio sp. OttesenSCG-928-O18]|nr:bifunctional adenosylcobinamide kinase/adenosylcobinamide-phosphate guanylyltransferase [Desulfovibrio sp. OttesenSCG-928-O18]